MFMILIVLFVGCKPKQQATDVAQFKTKNGKIAPTPGGKWTTVYNPITGETERKKNINSHEIVKYDAREFKKPKYKKRVNLRIKGSRKNKKKDKGEDDSDGTLSPSK